MNRILDAYGRPMVIEPKRNGHAPRAALYEMAADGEFPRRNGHAIRATYDAAQDTPEMRNYWAPADGLDADSANSKGVRAKLTRRSRYEVANNGYADGLVQTHANFLIGTGPRLRMQTKSRGFNQMVEDAWNRWCKHTLFRRKLWCMAHAKVQDGEAFGVLRSNPGNGDPVPLDLVLFECEQCTSPILPQFTAGYVDGIKFDEFGNPEWYDVLKYHPGGSYARSTIETERIAARWVLHWFNLRRPGQHRAVPEFRSTLNVGGGSRRWREATLAASETAADYSVVCQTRALPNGEADEAAPFTEQEIRKRMFVAMPMGWEAHQMKSEHPNATYESFHNSQVNEMARPKSIPQNVALCNSSGYNFASGKLDHGTYDLTIDVEREDCCDLALDKTFEIWFAWAVLAYGWAIEPTATPPHSWGWPAFPVGDVKAQSTANDTDLKNGAKSLSKIYHERGEDFEDEIQTMAQDYGVTVDEMRKLLLQRNLTSGPAAPGAPGQQQDIQDQQDGSGQEGDSND